MSFAKSIFIPLVSCFLITLLLALLITSYLNQSTNVANDDINILVKARSAEEIPDPAPTVSGEKTKNLISQWSGPVGGRQLYVANGALISKDYPILSADRDAIRLNIEKTGTKHAWDIQLVKTLDELTPHEIYAYSVWVNGPRGGEISINVETQDFQTITSKSLIFVGGWQELVIQFTTEASSVRIPLHLSFEENTGFSIDVGKDELI